ncbi:helix-turn-helix domain-containing protein [Actinomyces ruminicola]|uniref:Helix-turn-helix domain-containing protein n=1 Tax=Actinomyces ruminicola TaxID=332524 RepID=A0A1G9WTJ7_9ACTO|nr:helix-turn-helix domain-containing protein [Actinomyces ruminicola]SDM87882.1 Helix-turn-helix domain-containing protein [Actinomyces ruminicola]
MSARRKNDDHHEPDDPDIAQAMRARRQELGLSVPAMAARAGVSEQTWRNYEYGRTQVRGDKQMGVWEALEWEPPTHWRDLAGLRAILQGGGPDAFGAGFGGPDFDIPDELFEDIDSEEAAASLPIPDWDDIPTVLSEVYSPRLARTLGEDAARCYALGVLLFDMSITENLESLAELRGGTHLGELDETHIGSILPQLWLTRYDYEFVFQLRESLREMTRRLVSGVTTDNDPMACTIAEILVLHDVFSTGGVIADARGADIDEDRWEGWVDALSGPDQPAHALIAMGLIPPADAPEHFDNWFRPLPSPFIPDWDGASEGTGPTTAQADPGDATVTPLRRGH